MYQYAHSSARFAGSLVVAAIAAPRNPRMVSSAVLRGLRGSICLVAAGRLRCVLRRNQRSVRIAIRLPAADLAQARRIAERRGIGCQTLMKTLVHEGLSCESRRA